MSLDLSYRARRILYATITEYVASGEPVGSRTLSRRYGLSLSAATIRNVLADLEEGGYLVQPHTSAGRIPTAKGFRVFVDALMQMREVANEDRARVLTRLRGVEPGQDVLREAGRMLSAMTGAAAVVVPPKPEEERLSHVRFMPLRPGELLAVLIARSGTVQNRVVKLGRDVEGHELERVHNLLDGIVREGKSLTELRESVASRVETERGEYSGLLAATQAMVDATVHAELRASMVIEGQGQLAGLPEFADVEKIRALLRTFEDEERLLELLDRTLVAGGVNVLIGGEAHLQQDLSVVAAQYGKGSSTGSVGVIGPTRMDYGKVVPLVGFTARVVSDVLDGDEDT